MGFMFMNDHGHEQRSAKHNYNDFLTTNKWAFVSEMLYLISVTALSLIFW